MNDEVSNSSAAEHYLRYDLTIKKKLLVADADYVYISV